MAGRVIRRHLDYAEAIGRIRAHNYLSTDASHNPHKDSWAGASWDEAFDMAIKGWKQAVPRLSTGVQAAIAASRRPQFVAGPVGGSTNMGAYLQGRPDCMVNVIRTTRPSPVVRIGIDNTAAAGIAGERMEAVGRNCLVVLESLRMAGIPAEVWVCGTIGSGYERGKAAGEFYDLRIKVQEAGRPLDISRLAFWVAHPASLRRLKFALEETEDKSTRETFGITPHGGYGFPALDYAKGEFDEWVPSAQNSDATINAWVADVLSRRIGVVYK